MDHRGLGGFHGYRKPQQQQHPKPTSASAADLRVPDMNNLGLITASEHMNNHVSNAGNGGRTELVNHTPCNNYNNGSSSNNTNHSADHQDMNNNECTVREQDRFMPIANVIRIMRKILPPHAKISDDAKETIQECVSEFISFITGEANERCQREQRKTITAEDVLWAMSKLGFDDYIEPLTLYLHRYRELEGDRGSIRTCEPLLKMSRAAMDQYAAFGPVFHIHHPHHHPHPHPHHPPPGYYPGPPPPSSVNGYLKEPSSTASGSDHATTTNSQSPATATNAASSGTTAVTSFEPYGQPAK